MKRLFAPEVIQTSNLDCGPAALKCLLEGFNIPVSYGRLREACQTGLDGTSIDTMELVANQLGLQAEQITVPADHVFVPEAATLPAIIIVQLPTGLTHFIVVWSQFGSFVQIMDPATGRRWVHRDSLVRELYRHRMPVPAEGWREWAGTEDFLSVLKVRLRALGLSTGDVSTLLTAALADPSWHGLSALDAATRFVRSLADSRVITGSGERARLLRQCQQTPAVIPDQYWTATPASPDQDGNEQVHVAGAVLVRAVSAKAPETAPLADSDQPSIHRAESRPLRFGFRVLRETGPVGIAAVALGVITAASLSVLEAVLFRSLFEVFARLQLPAQRFGALLALGLFALAALGLEWAIVTGIVRLGRQLETRLRLAFLRKLPRLSDRYFQSRLISDLADRAHAIYRLKQLPNGLGQFVQPLTKLVLTAAGLLWLLPQSWALILLAIAATVIPPLAAIPVVRERDLKTRTHAGALMRFYLDAMLGLLPIRAHGAARNMQAEQEKLVGEWAASALALQRSALVFEGVQTVLVLSLVATVLLTQSFQSTAAGRVLLIVYWALNIPLLGRDFASQVRRYPFYRNLLARLVEPLEAPEEQVEPNTAPLTHAPAIEFQNASATVAGANILNGVDLAIKPGEHVAIIGPSGAGKSSLISLLLGWLPQSGGTVLVDGRPLNVEQLRRSVAWIDPAVQIWNDSLFSNIAYGSDTATHQVSTALDEAMLRPVLENLPSGLQTKLGESGGLVSGGEGQRVRFARAAIRHDANLAILDEPFRGLDRDKRRELLARSRRIWRHATMLCITHDIHQTRQFDRVIVVESGSISESGKPADLLSNPASRYSQLIAAERNNQVGLWSARFWRRIWVEKGNAIESVSSNGTEAEVA